MQTKKVKTFEVNEANTEKVHAICSQLRVKKPKQCHYHGSMVFLVKTDMCMFYALLLMVSFLLDQRLELQNYTDYKRI